MAMSMQELFYGHSDPVYFLQPSYAPEHHEHRHMDRFDQASYAPAVSERGMDRFDQASYAPAVSERRTDRFEQASYAPAVSERRMDRFDQASYAPAVSERRMDRFDMMVPMCCARCEHEIRNALFALRGVQDVVCDARNQRVIVTGFLEPALALKQVRQVKNGATLWSRSLYSRSRDDAYSRRLCPAYRDSTETHYMSFNPSIAIRVENEC